MVSVARVLRSADAVLVIVAVIAPEVTSRMAITFATEASASDPLLTATENVAAPSEVSAARPAKSEADPVTESRLERPTAPAAVFTSAIAAISSASVAAPAASGATVNVAVAGIIIVPLAIAAASSDAVPVTVAPAFTTTSPAAFRPSRRTRSATATVSSESSKSAVAVISTELAVAAASRASIFSTLPVNLVAAVAVTSMDVLAARAVRSDASTVASATVIARLELAARTSPSANLARPNAAPASAIVWVVTVPATVVVAVELAIMPLRSLTVFVPVTLTANVEFRAVPQSTPALLEFNAAEISDAAPAMPVVADASIATVVLPAIEAIFAASDTRPDRLRVI